MKSTLTPYYREGILTYAKPDGTMSSVKGKFCVAVNGYGDEIVMRRDPDRQVGKVFTPRSSVYTFVPKVEA